MPLLSHSDINFTFRCHRHVVDNTTDKLAATFGTSYRTASSSSSSSSSKVTKIYAVNDIQFHPMHSTTMATAGSDGSFVFWDRVSRSRLTKYPPVSASASSPAAATTERGGGDEPPAPAITATSFSRDGHFFAYAVGYDWSRGCAGNTPQTESKVMLHPVLEDEVKPKPALQSRTGRRY